jgi:FkbM family methyltransferase
MKSGREAAAGSLLGDRKDDRRAELVFQLIGRARRLSGHLPGRWDRRARDLGKAMVNYRGARRTYLRQALFSMLGRGSEVLLAPFGRVALLVPADDDEIGRVVFATGGYERVYMQCAVEELRRLGVPLEGTTFLDVGANIGTSTVDALVDFGFGRAVCFEPDERSFRLLMANVAINGLEGRVQAYQAALSAADGSSRLAISSTNHADNRLVEGPEPDGDRGEQLVEVRCRSFDSLVEEGEIELEHLGVIWLDAQGHEPLVLEGARTALEAGIPLVMEYTPAALCEGATLLELETTIEAYYTTVVDLHLMASGLRSQAVFPTSEVRRLRDNGGREHTDLLLVRSPAPGA